MIALISLASCTNKAKEKEIVSLKAKIEMLQNKITEDSINCIRSINTLMVEKENANVCKKYEMYIVVGCFTEPERATKWSAHCDELGFTSCIVKDGKWYEVWVKGSNDLKEALKIMENVRERITSRAWVNIINK